jgi:hypothetical protein
MILLFAGKINKKVKGNARYNPQIFLNTLRTLAKYIARLMPELSSNWIVSYIKIGGHGKVIVLATFKLAMQVLHSFVLYLLIIVS